MIGNRTEALESTRRASAGGRRHGVSELYSVGALRFSERSLKTVHAYVSRSRLRHNARVIKSVIGPGVRLCAMVKANGYGLDARNVVSALTGEADWFAVASLEEAETIQAFAGDHPVLATCPVFAGIDPGLVRLAVARGIHVTVCSGEALRYLQGVLRPGEGRLNVHLKVDTGMGRLGCSEEEAPALLGALSYTPGVKLAGVYTHFATADEGDLSYAREQLGRYREVLRSAGLDRGGAVLRHAANSSAALRLGEARFDMVRCGIGLYGYVNFEGEGAAADLRPVVRVEAPVVQVRTLRAGESCGYGRTFTVEEETVIGVVPVGYADGFSRFLSNRGVMRCGEQYVPVVGRVSMDLTIVDLTGVAGAREGMIVTVLDDRVGSAANAAGHAAAAGMVPYEVLTSMGNRVKRVLEE